MNELVLMKNNQAITSSKKIAEVFGKNHRDVLKAIDNLIGGLRKTAQAPQMFYFREETDPQNGQEYRVCYMNRDGFSLLVMGFKGQKALEWKLKYIEAFNQMEAQLKNPDIKRLLARERGKEARKGLTDSIKECIPEGPNKHWAYSNYTNLVYRIIFNKSAAELRKERGATKETLLRDYLSSEELEKVKRVEDLAKNFVYVGMDYEQVKAMLENMFPNGVHLALEVGR